jgi:hypothetical protein
MSISIFKNYQIENAKILTVKFLGEEFEFVLTPKERVIQHNILRLVCRDFYCFKYYRTHEIEEISFWSKKEPGDVYIYKTARVNVQFFPLDRREQIRSYGKGIIEGHEYTNQTDIYNMAKICQLGYNKRIK